MLQWYHLKVSFADKCFNSFKSFVLSSFNSQSGISYRYPFLMRNFTLRPIWGIFCGVKKSGTTLVQYTYRCHRGLETPFKTTGLSLGWIPASVIGLEDRQGQHLTSSRKVGFPVPYLRVKPNLPVPPISGRPTSPRGGGGGGFQLVGTWFGATVWWWKESTKKPPEM